MKIEQVAGIAIAIFGLAAMALAFHIRGRRVQDVRAMPGGLRPVKAVASPEGAWLAVVLSGPPFESAVDSIAETGLWMFFWLLPWRLSRIEVWLVAVPEGAPDRPVKEIIGEAPPAARQVIWRGEGGRRRAGEVEVTWTGGRSFRASFRGVVHEVQVPEAADIRSTSHVPRMDRSFPLL